MAIRLYLGPGMRFPTDEHAPVVVPRGSVLGEVQVRRVILKGINEVSPSALSLFVLIGALSTPIIIPTESAEVFDCRRRFCDLWRSYERSYPCLPRISTWIHAAARSTFF